MAYRLIVHASGAFGAAGASSSAGTSPVITALIAAVGTILTAALAAWAARRRLRKDKPDTTMPPAVQDITTRYVTELLNRAERAEARLKRAETRLEDLELENGRLRERTTQTGSCQSAT